MKLMSCCAENHQRNKKEAAISALQAQSAQGCVLLGEPDYYRRFGFRTVPGLELPGVPAEYFQALSFEGPPPQGQVSYHRAFNARD